MRKRSWINWFLGCYLFGNHLWAEKREHDRMLCVKCGRVYNWDGKRLG